MEHPEIETGKPFRNGEIVNYQESSIVITTIINRPTGHVSIAAFDSGESLEGKVSPFNALLQIIDGNAEVIIDGESNFLQVGESIIVPANLKNALRAIDRFKVLSTIIKTGYED